EAGARGARGDRTERRVEDQRGDEGAGEQPVVGVDAGLDAERVAQRPQDVGRRQEAEEADEGERQRRELAPAHVERAAGAGAVHRGQDHDPTRIIPASGAESRCYISMLQVAPEAARRAPRRSPAAFTCSARGPGSPPPWPARSRWRSPCGRTRRPARRRARAAPPASPRAPGGTPPPRGSAPRDPWPAPAAPPPPARSTGANPAPRSKAAAAWPPGAGA